jgi:hypothetical protein
MSWDKKESPGTVRVKSLEAVNRFLPQWRGLKSKGHKMNDLAIVEKAGANGRD